MSRGGGRCPRRARFSYCRHRGGAKIGAGGGGIDRVVKPASVGIYCGGGGSICVRECHKVRSRLCIDAKGNLYVLDSEDEDSVTEVAADGVGVATEGAMNRNRAGSYHLSMEGPPMVHADTDRAAVKDLPPKAPPLVARDEDASDNLSSTGPPLVPTDKAEEMDLAPEVAARLKEVLANMDPIYHDVFVKTSMMGSNSSFTSGASKSRSSWCTAMKNLEMLGLTFLEMDCLWRMDFKALVICMFFIQAAGVEGG